MTKHRNERYRAENFQDLKERKINLQNQYDNIISKLWEEYELTKREAEEQAIEIPDSNAAQKRLNELKQKN